MKPKTGKVELVRTPRNAARLLFLQGVEILMIPRKLDPLDERNRGHVRIISIESLKRESRELERMIEEGLVSETFNSVAFDRSQIRETTKNGNYWAFYYDKLKGLNEQSKGQEVIGLTQELIKFIKESAVGVKERPTVIKLLRGLNYFTGTLERYGLIEEEEEIKGRNKYSRGIPYHEIEEEQLRELEVKKQQAKRPIGELNLVRVNITRAQNAFYSGFIVWMLPWGMSPKSEVAKRYAEAFIDGCPLDENSLTHLSKYDRFELYGGIIGRYCQYKCEPPNFYSFYIEDREEDSQIEKEILLRAKKLKELLEDLPVEFKKTSGFKSLLYVLKSKTGSNAIARELESMN